MTGKWAALLAGIWLLSGKSPAGSLFCKGMGKKGFILLLFLLFLSGWGRMSYANHLESKESELCDGESLWITATVTGRKTGEYQTVYYLEDAICIKSDGRQFRLARLYGTYTEKNSWYMGSRIRFQGCLEMFEIDRNPGVFDSRAYYRSLGYSLRTDMEEVCCVAKAQGDWREIVRGWSEKLSAQLSRLLLEREAGIARAMLLGDKEQLPEDIEKLYQKNGLSHILAISGLHVNLLGMSLYRNLRKCRLPIWACSAAAVVFLLLYGMMTGFSISSTRAIIMGILFLMGQIPGRGSDLVTSAIISGVIAVWDIPWQISNTGFQLSYGAVLGIGLIQPVLKKRLPVPDSICVSLSVQIMILPVLLRSFYTLPVYSILLNLVVIPLMVPLTGILTGCLILSLFWFQAGRFIAGGAFVILRFYEWLCYVTGQLPGYLVVTGSPSVGQTILYYILMAGAMALLVREKKIFGTLILSVGMAVLLTVPARHNLSVTMLDVSQGESLLLELPAGETVLVDGGSSDRKSIGEYTLKPVLQSKGISRLDMILITHWDEDHVNGIMELLSEDWLKCNMILLPAVSEEGTEAEGLIELKTWLTAGKINWNTIGTGDLVQLGQMQLKCLSPEQGQQVDSSNESSIVLRMQYGEFSMLLTGDIGEDSEKYLQKQFCEPVTILKAAHHGSGYSTSAEFLAWCQPQAAIISCGRDNSYGHPHPELLERLAERQIPWYVTAEKGAVQINTNGSSWSVKCWLDEKQ